MSTKSHIHDQKYSRKQLISLGAVMFVGFLITLLTMNQRPLGLFSRASTPSQPVVNPGTQIAPAALQGGTKRIAVMLVGFANETNHDGVTAAGMQQVMFGTSPHATANDYSVKQYLEESSQSSPNRLTITGQVYDWRDLPFNQSSQNETRFNSPNGTPVVTNSTMWNCRSTPGPTQNVDTLNTILRRWAAEAKSAAGNPTADYYIYVFPSSYYQQGGTYCNTGVFWEKGYLLDGNNIFIDGWDDWPYGSPDSKQKAVIIHQLGHAFGLKNALALDPYNSVIKEGFNFYDGMRQYGVQLANYSNFVNMLGFSSATKKALGWVNSLTLQSGNCSYTIAPLAAVTSQPQAINFTLNGANYFLDYRTPIGVDNSYPITDNQGIVISEYRSDSTVVLYDATKGSHPTDDTYDAPLSTVGSTYNAGDFDVTLQSKTASAATVRVRIPPGTTSACTGGSVPTPTYTPIPTVTPRPQPTYPYNVYLPQVFKNADGGANRLPSIGGPFGSSYSVQNVSGAAAANCIAYYYTPAGAQAASHTIPQSGSIGIDKSAYITVGQTAGTTGLPNGTYSAQISCSQKVAVVSTFADSDGGSGTGAYRGIGTGSDTPTTTWFIPSIYNNYYNYYSNVVIQNPSAATVNATMFVYDGANQITSRKVTIGPRAVVVIPQYNMTALDSIHNKTYAGRIVADAPVAVVGNIYGWKADGSIPTGQLYSITGIRSNAGSKLTYAPVIMNNYYGYNTALAIQNLNSVAVNFTATYTGVTGDVVVRGTIPANAKDEKYTPGLPLPKGNNQISVRVSSDNGLPLALLVNESDVHNRAASYTGFAQGSKTVYVPIVSNGFNNMNTSVTCQNINTTKVTTSLRIIYSNLAGAEVGRKDSTKQPGQYESYQFYQPNDGLPANFNGSAVITSTVTPVICVVNQNRNLPPYDTQPRDFLSSYEAIAKP